MTLQDKIKQSEKMAAAAIYKYKPYKKVALVSGGDDSMTLVELCRMIGLIDVVLHVDTTTGIKSTTDTVYEYCDKNKLNFMQVRTPEQTFEEIVMVHGFPGPDQHNTMYSRLKERALRVAERQFQHEGTFCAIKPQYSPYPTKNFHLPLQFHKDYPQNENLVFKKKDRILMYFTGARRDESVRRMGNVVDIMKNGNIVWVNLIANWTKKDISEFREQTKLIQSPAAKLLCRSAECNCGSFGSYGEFHELKYHFKNDPNVIMLNRVQGELMAKGHEFCRYGHGGDNRGIDPEQEMRDMILCSTCLIRQEQKVNNSVNSKA